MDFADLEDLLAAEPELFVPASLGLFIFTFLPLCSELSFIPAGFDVPKQFDADLLRIEPLWAHRHCSGMMVGIDNNFGVCQAVLCHDG